MAAGRVGELAAVLITAAALRRSLLPRGTGGKLLLAAAGAGAINVVANTCYVAATRTGMLGLAVVLASLYPGVTVLLAKMVLGEQLRWVQRAGLGLAAIGIILVTMSPSTAQATTMRADHPVRHTAQLARSASR